MDSTARDLLCIALCYTRKRANHLSMALGLPGLPVCLLHPGFRWSRLTIPD
jgi:hypothetical protein